MKEESILYELEANKEYEFHVKYYGSYDVIFCETFSLEIYIEPFNSIYRVENCAGQNPVLLGSPFL